MEDARNIKHTIQSVIISVCQANEYAATVTTDAIFNILYEEGLIGVAQGKGKAKRKKPKMP